jgi:serine/threonine protein kinase/tetratricopeptide (TPR) repeat protein
MANLKPCPECGAPLPVHLGDSPQGCPVCSLFGVPNHDTERFSGPTERAGDQIGRYRLVEKIGEGGFGIVYHAEQLTPVRRSVALKIIKAGMDTRQVIARFETERQALAMMEHTSIAKVFDAGATETGRPYFVMELVKGDRITDYCEQNRLSVSARLCLFIKVCHAIQHAHQKGVIHRDIKPSNVLVVQQDGEATPKVIDFGIAKAIQAQSGGMTPVTALDQLIGTPAYMSPEQALFSSGNIDTRSDIYSLGVLLYELLTGKPPFSYDFLTTRIDEMRRIIREEDPRRPSEAAPRNGKEKHSVARDLDLIAMKALEKDRSRRYETASAFADDIQRHLGHQPILAAPPSVGYTLRKFASRHTLLLTSVAAVSAAILSGAFISAWQAVRATRAQARSDQVKIFLESMLKGVGPSVALGRDITIVREILDQTAERIGNELRQQPAVEAELRALIGEVYVELGEYAKAETMQQAALHLAKQVYGPEHPEVASALDNMAVLRYRQGRLDEAVAHERQALAMRIKFLGKDDPKVAMSLINLAVFLQEQSKLDEAESVSRQAVAASRKAFGHNSQYAITSLNNLATVLCLHGEKNKLQEVQDIFQEVLAAQRKLFGKDHPDVATSLNNLAKVLADQGRRADAEQMFREALAMRKKILGEDHPDVAQTLDSLAGTVQDANKLADAEAMYRQALAIRTKALGSEHPYVALSLNNLADVLEDEGKISEAEAMQREALAIQRKVLGNEHLDVARSLQNLARLSESSGTAADREIMLKESLATRQKLLGNGHSDAISSLADLVTVLLAELKFTEAELLARQGLPLQEKKDPDNWRTFNIRGLLGASLLGQHKFAEAEPLLLSGYAGMKEKEDKIPAYIRSQIKAAAERLIRLYEATNRADQAAIWKKKLEAAVTAVK